MRCVNCDQDVVQQGFFWVLPEEVGSKMVTFCPEAGSDTKLHVVDEEDADEEDEDDPYIVRILSEGIAERESYRDLLQRVYNEVEPANMPDDLRAAVEEALG